MFSLASPVCAEQLAERPSLLAAELGKDSALGRSGVTLDQSITQYYGAVVDGGRDELEYYSGRWDLLASIDGEKAGLWPGLFMKMRVGANWHPVERFGAGTLLPPYIGGSIPKGDNESIAITELSAIQMFSTRFGITAGKIDTIDGDLNSFAAGRGIEQFQNLAFNLNPIPVYVPLSTLGAGAFALYADGTPLASLSVLDTHYVPTDSGFDDLFSDGAVLAGEAEFPTDFASRSGRHRFGFTYTNSERTSIEQDPRYVLETGSLQTESDAWAVTYNGEQYLVSDPIDPKVGWGIFARAGLSDENKNFVHYFLSVGIGGSGLIEERKDDKFGLGYFHLETADLFSRVDALAEQIGNEDGVELFYDAAVVPWLRVAADLQYVDGVIENADGAWILSGRVRILL